MDRCSPSAPEPVPPSAAENVPIPSLQDLPMARLAELFNEPSAAATLFRHCGAVAFRQGQLLHRLTGQPAGSETLLVDLPQPPATAAFSRRCCLPEAAFAAQPTARFASA